MKEVTLGADDDETSCKNSYNNAIKILNDEANDKEYFNDTYISSARCVGSVPDNPYSENEEEIQSLKAEDENYITDYTQLGKIPNALNINKNYWLASRIRKWWRSIADKLMDYSMLMKKETCQKREHLMMLY